MNKALSFVLLLAVVGIASWLLLRGTDDMAPAGSTPPGAVERGATADGPIQASTGAVERAAGSGGPAAAERSAAIPAGAGADAKPSIVRGRIVDARRAARPAVALQLRSWLLPEGVDVDMPMPPNSDRSEAPAATTRADGTFEVLVARDRHGMLELAADDLVFLTDGPRFDGRKGDQDLGDIVVVRSGHLRGFVRDEHARPVPGVRVSATVGVLGLGAVSASTTDANGGFTVGKLRPGTWTLRTASDKFLPAIVEVQLPAEESRDDVVLVVRPGQAIAGQVVDDLGRPVAGCRVGSKRREARGGMDIERFAADEAATTDANGYFTLSGLAGETATVRAFGTGHASAVAKDVPVGTGNLLLRIDRLAEVRGVLLAADGTPIEGSKVRAEPARGPGVAGVEVHDFDTLDFGGRAAAKTAADGTFRIAGVRPGTTAVVAEGKTHLPARVDALVVEPGRVLDGVRLVADAGASVQVTVVDGDARPVAGAKVRIERPRRGSDVAGIGEAIAHEVEVAGAADAEAAMRFLGDDPSLGVATTDERGIATVIGLPEGSAVVLASHVDHADAAPVPLVLPKAGTIEAKAMLRVPGHVEARVLTADGRAAPDCTVVVRPDAGGPERNGTTDAQGLARVGPLVAGSYSVFLRRDGGGIRHGDMVFVMDAANEGLEGTKRPCTVVAGETTRVDIVRPILTRLHGVVMGVDGGVADCVVELARGGDGPRLPGIGGRNVRTSADGTYSFDDVESGRYTLHFGKEQQLVKSTAEVRIAPNTPDLRADLTLRTGRLRVLVCAKDSGKPLEGASVQLEPVRAADSEDGEAQQTQQVMMVAISADDHEGGGVTSMTVGMPLVRTGADGVAEIDDVPAGAYTIHVEHDRHASADLADQVVSERQTTDCGRVALERAGTIRGTVLTSDGRRVPIALVQCRAAGGQDWGQPEVAEGGAFRLTGRAIGKHVLRARSIDQGPAGATGPEVEVDVVANETVTAELRLPAK